MSEQQSLTILKLASPLLSGDPAAVHEAIGFPSGEEGFRASDVSASGIPFLSAGQDDKITPQTLAADLASYKELFKKLRFSYVAQVTKEKTLRALVAEPEPLLVTPKQNAELDSELALRKDKLNTQKSDVRDTLEALGKEARDLARRYVKVGEERDELERLPKQIATVLTDVQNLESEIAELEKLEQAAASNRRQPSDEAEREIWKLNAEQLESRLTEEREQSKANQRKCESLDAEIAAAEAELRLVQSDNEPLQRELEKARAEAEKAQKRKAALDSGRGDAMDDEGRWLSTSAKLMEALVPS